MSFIKDQRGGTVLEYGIVAALFAFAVLTGMTIIDSRKSAKCPEDTLQSTAPAHMGSAGTPPG